MDQELTKSKIIEQSDNIMSSATNISADSMLPQQTKIIKIIESIKASINSYEEARNVRFTDEVLEYAIQQTLCKSRELGLNLKPQNILELAAITRRKIAETMPEDYQSAIGKANSIIADINQTTKANDRRLLEAQLRDHGREWLPKLNEWKENKSNTQTVTTQDIDNALDYIVNKSK
jgi:hypothetical protein